VVQIGSRKNSPKWVDGKRNLVDSSCCACRYSGVVAEWKVTAEALPALAAETTSARRNASASTLRIAREYLFNRVSQENTWRARLAGPPAAPRERRPTRSRPGASAPGPARAAAR